MHGEDQSRKLARARLLERQQAAAVAREARELDNIGDLTEFAVWAAQVDAIDGWLAPRTEKLKAEGRAPAPRPSRRGEEGFARDALRGENVTAIAP
jgi:hypothetical protein